MGKTHAFATIRRARSLRERHPDAPLSVIAIAQNLATYANGHTGTSIRPGHARVAAETGLSERTVRGGIRWLIEREEIRRDKPGHRGSAACYTYLGVSSNGGGLEPPFDGKGAAGRRNGGGSTPPTNPTSQTSGPFQDPSGSDGWHVEREAGEDSAPTHRSSPSGFAPDPVGQCEHCGRALIVYNRGTEEEFIGCTGCHRIPKQAR